MLKSNITNGLTYGHYLLKNTHERAYTYHTEILDKFFNMVDYYLT